MPSGLQFRDVLTKPEDSREWWNMVRPKLRVLLRDIGPAKKASETIAETGTSVKPNVRVSEEYNIAFSDLIHAG